MQEIYLFDVCPGLHVGRWSNLPGSAFTSLCMASAHVMRTWLAGGASLGLSGRNNMAGQSYSEHSVLEKYGASSRICQVSNAFE